MPRKQKRKIQYQVEGFVIQDPQNPGYYFMAWRIDETGRGVIWSKSIPEFWIFRTKTQANKFNQVLKGKVKRIFIKG